MPSGYRYILAALIGWMTLVGASSQNDKESKRNQFTSQSAVRQDLERIATAIEKLPQTVASDRGCTPGQDDHGSELCAQWKAADAAAGATFWTMLTFLAGTCIGAATLVFAARAAYWARAAAIHTEAGAKEGAASASAAREANALASNAFYNQDRPYLVAEHVNENFRDWSNGEHHEWRVKLTNYGRGIAYLEHVAIGCALSTDLPPLQEVREFSDTESVLIKEPFAYRVYRQQPIKVLSSGESNAFCGGVISQIQTLNNIPPDLRKLRESRYLQIIGGNIPIWITGYAAYRDVFNRQHHIQFCWKILYPQAEISVAGGDEYNSVS